MATINGFIDNFDGKHDEMPNDSVVNGIDEQTHLVKHVQQLIPAMKESFNQISEQFSQFLDYADELEQLSLKLQMSQRKEEELKEELQEMKQIRNNVMKQCQINSESRVYLDVGGQPFTTTVERLTKEMDSPFFDTLLAEKWDPTTNSSENRIFIDRDGRLFDYVLKYLRTGELLIDDKTIRKELMTEARFYHYKKLEDELTRLARKDYLAAPMFSHDGLNPSPPSSPAVTLSRTRSSPYCTINVPQTPPRSINGNPLPLLKSKIHPAQTALSWRSTSATDVRLNVFVGSCLLTCEFEEKLIEFLGNDVEQTNQSWRLIYRASEHGFDASDFHRCCDTFAPTISIIQTDFGNLFGGFTSVPWSSSQHRADQADSTAFLFTLKNTVNISPTKFPIAKEHEKSAISHNPTCGPNFGSPKNVGSDLCLRNKFNDKSNCIFFPKSYVDSTGQGSVVFAKRYFACKEVEVFALLRD